MERSKIETLQLASSPSISLYLLPFSHWLKGFFDKTYHSYKHHKESQAVQENTFPTERYYAVVILNELSSPSPSHRTLYEEEIIMILSVSENDARERGIRYAKAQECSYQNQFSQTINHRFKAVKDVQMMPELTKETTVYSRFFSNIETYEAFDADASGLEVTDVA
jgi:hypothetical protein